VEHQTSRIQYLDGLRGVAILSVLMFHAFSRWPGIVPYGSEFVKVPIFFYGWLGVQLFFMISGYVIFMSLERSRNLHGFLIRRWIRLFPAMLACSLIVFATASFFHERPAGAPVLRDLLPGLTFIEPYWWQLVLGSPQGELEGVFWSLYVEVKLYLVAGFFYFTIGGRRVIWVLVGLFLVATGVLFFNQVFVENGWTQARAILNALSGRPSGWFAAGALFYRFHNEGKKGVLAAAILVAVATALAQGKPDYGAKPYEWDVTFAALTVVLIFAAAALNDRVKQVFSSRLLLFMGFISYPLYLLHENMMVSMIVKTNTILPQIPSVLLPAIPILFVVGVAWLVAKFIDPPARAWLKKWHLKLQTSSQNGLKSISVKLNIRKAE